MSQPNTLSLMSLQDIKQIMRHNVLALLALTGLGIALPLLDLFGNNPQFFVAKNHTGVEMVMFGLILVIAAPLVSLLLEFTAYLADQYLGRITHSLLIFGLGALFALVILRKMAWESNALIMAFAICSGGLILVAERRSQVFQKLLRFFAFAPLAALVLFLTVSSSARLIWIGEAQAMSVPGIGRPAPVVILAFDEFPLASLLKADGTINAQRFPNFARLADQSLWFRNASSVAPFTGGSIASAVSSEMPIHEKAPNSIEYPHNLFTLLGDSYPMVVHEEVTQFCPRDLCQHPRDIAGTGVSSAINTPQQRIHSSLLDAFVVYAHATLPPNWRAKLPPVSRSWGDFLGQDSDAVNAALPREPGPHDPHAPAGRTTPVQGKHLETLFASIQPSNDPTLYFAHVVLPHFPWEMTPSGYHYQPEARLYDDLEAIPGLIKNGDHWGDNEFLVRQGFQRHLLQVGYVDGLVGQLIDRMQQGGLWDDAVVIVFADHGVSFIPDHPRRGPTPDNLDEIFRVPFFIKLPGQVKGEIRDDNAMLIDLIPTLVDILQVETGWKFNGRSLIADTPAPPQKRVMEGPEGAIPVSLDGLLGVARRNASVFNYREDWAGVAAVGKNGMLVGEPTGVLAEKWHSDFEWIIDQAPAINEINPSSGYVPILVTGRIFIPPGAAPPQEVLISVNEIIAGVGGGFECEGEECRFSALLAEQFLWEGRNEIRVLAPR